VNEVVSDAHRELLPGRMLTQEAVRPRRPRPFRDGGHGWWLELGGRR
jgi:hypothetical protein